MSQTSSLTVWQYLRSRDALLTIIMPIVIYNIAFWQGGAGVALLITAVYSGVLQYFSRQKGSLAIIALILMSGFSHYLYLKGYNLLGIEHESVFLSISGAVSMVVVFGFYSLRGRPVIRTLAEQATPTLKTLPVYDTPLYAKVWHEISLCWILVYLLKAIMIYTLSTFPQLPMDLIVIISGWPITLMMVAFSFQWPKYRWASQTDSKVP
ncbi:hypothetical protein [Pectobacterium aroidearum]|uniref:hypothetical protein n=1 Tax=Pectobacterium aroidearum TaxID=1201031 RepID=UPI0032EAD4DE